MKNYAIKEHHLYNKAFTKGTRAVGKMVAVYVLRDYAAKRLRLANPRKEYLNRVGLSVGKKIGSTAMVATAADSLSDTIATAVVLLSMLISRLTSWNIDGYAGVLVALFIF